MDLGFGDGSVLIFMEENECWSSLHGVEAYRNPDIYGGKLSLKLAHIVSIIEEFEYHTDLLYANHTSWRKSYETLCMIYIFEVHKINTTAIL